MSNQYISKINRRDSLKWLGSLSSVVVVGGVVVACDTPQEPMPEVSGESNWPNLTFEPINAPGYGTDPDLLNPSAPWPKTLTADQLNMVAHLSDIICPADDGGPSATAVGVPDVIDEWVSAPYPSQQSDRVLILNGLEWLNEESDRRYGNNFMNASEGEQLQIIDDIAYEAQLEVPEFEHAAIFFAKLRTLVLGAYFTSPAGMEDIGYMGNVPILGDYPGPSEEAKAHLDQIIDSLP